MYIDQLFTPITEAVGTVPRARDLTSGDAGIPDIYNPSTGQNYTRAELIALGALPPDSAVPTAAPAVPARSTPRLGQAVEPAPQLDAPARPTPRLADPDSAAGASAMASMASQLTPSATGGRITRTGSGLRHRASATNPNQPTGAAVRSGAPSDNAAVTKMPGQQRSAVQKPNFAAPSSYGKTTMSVKPAAVARPQPAMAESQRAFVKQTVSEVRAQLATATTKEDIARIKQHIDRAFVQRGLITEGAQDLRNRMIRQVVNIGAQRRRQAAKH